MPTRFPEECMKRMTLTLSGLVLSAALAIGLAPTQTTAQTAPAAPQSTSQRTVNVDAKGNPVTDPALDPLRTYHDNTYTCYWPGAWECHHWWNADGTEQFFQVNWMPEGMVMLKLSDGM